MFTEKQAKNKQTAQPRDASKRSRVLLSWGFSYAVIIVLPLILGLTAYSNILADFETETRNANAAVLNIVGREIDAFFDSCDVTFDEVFLDAGFSGVKYSGEEVIDAAFRYKLWNIIQTRVKTLAVSQGSTLGFYVYLPNSGMLLTNSRYCQVEEAYSYYFKDSGLSLEEFTRFLATPSVKSIEPVGDARYFLYSSAQVSLGYTLKAIAKVDRRMIDGITGGVDWVDQSRYFAFSKDGALLMTNAESAMQEQVLGGGLMADGRDEVVLDGVTYIVQRNKQNTRLDYLYLVPRGTLYTNIADSIRIIVIVNVLCLLIGAAISALFIKRNYKPIANIMEHIAANMQHSHEGNEYETILNAISETVGNNKALAQRLTAAQRDSGHELLRRYLNGVFMETSLIRERLSVLGVRLLSERFVAAVFWVNGWVEELAAEISQDDKTLLHFAAFNIFEERLRDWADVVWIDSYEYFILLAGVQNEQSLTDILNILNDTKNDALTYARLDILISVSDAVVFDELPVAYHAAVDSLRYRMLHNTTDVITPQNADITETKTPVFRSEDKIALHTAIRRNDAAAAEEIINHFIRQMQDGLAAEPAFFLLVDIVSSLVRVIQSLPEQYSNRLLNERDYLRRVMNSASLNQTADILRSMIREICCVVSEHLSSGKTALFMRIKALIAANLCSNDLSCAWIAQTLSLNPSYLSTYFKECAGVGLTEYINSERIEQAKQMLGRKELKIKEIATSLGFSSDVTFIRVFKSRMGMTPGEYRERNFCDKPKSTSGPSSH